ncbi:MAG: hypothetical protein F7C38_04315 [Desulfurococcales archaeon]|nr:hypothetical protein [Desulfurococcales archaeon]
MVRANKELRPIYDELEPVYAALARASLNARSDLEWGYVRDRLDDFASKMEEFVGTYKRLGWKTMEKTVVEGLAVLDSAGERWKLVDAVLKLEERFDKIIKITSIAYNYIFRARIVSYSVAFLTSILMVLSSPNLLGLSLSMVVLSMAMAALLLSASSYSSYPAAAAIILFIINIISNKYLISIKASAILSIILLAITISLPSALKRTFNIEGLRS